MCNLTINVSAAMIKAKLLYDKKKTYNISGDLLVKTVVELPKPLGHRDPK